MKMTINVPRENELVIAPGRHFKVSGTFEGNVPDNATSLLLLQESLSLTRFRMTSWFGETRFWVPAIA